MVSTSTTRSNPLISLRAQLSLSARIIERSNVKDYASAIEQIASNANDPGWSHDNIDPDVVIYCASEHDVVATVRTAAAHDIHLTARSGGHSYSGHSSRSHEAGGWVVDLSGLIAVTRDPNNDDVVCVGAGLKLHRLNAELLRFGLSFPKGTCRGVAIGGHLQSSASGPLKVAFGSGLDHVRQFRIVLASGEVVIAKSDNEYSEIYFCVLGGFPGSFGIVTEYTLRCINDRHVPHARLITRSWSLDQLDQGGIERILTHAQNVARTQVSDNRRDVCVTVVIGLAHGGVDMLPDIPLLGHVSQYPCLKRFFCVPNAAASKHVVQVILLWTGGEFTSVHYKKLVTPFDRITQGQKWWFPNAINWNLSLSKITSLAVSALPPSGHRHVICGNHSRDWLPADAIHSISAECVRRVRTEHPFLIQIFMYGGAWIQNKTRNALGFRDAYVVMDDTIFFRHRNAAAVSQELNTFHATIPWSTVDVSRAGSPTVKQVRLETFMTPDVYERSVRERPVEELRAYYPAPGALKRLLRLKSQVDPRDMFNGAGTVPPLHETAL